MSYVGICLSSNGLCHTAMAQSLAYVAAAAGQPGRDWDIINSESALNMVNRNQAVDVARRKGFSHVLFLDSDMTFHPLTIPRLLEWNVDIVGCQYVRRFYPHGILGRLMTERRGDLQEAMELPSGCFLIRLSVFDKLAAPYFRCVAMEEADRLPPDVAGFDLAGYEFPATMSEDYYFCQAARRAGFRVWADVPLSRTLEHYGYVPFQIPSEGGDETPA